MDLQSLDLSWPPVSGPKITIDHLDVQDVARPHYKQVNIITSLEGQIPSDQCAWLVEFVDEFAYNPKRHLDFSFLPDVLESYLTSGNPNIERRPAILIIPRAAEPIYWEALALGRDTGTYQPIFFSGNVTLAAMGQSYTTAP
jgi:hypothetical protein